MTAEKRNMRVQIEIITRQSTEEGTETLRHSAPGTLRRENGTAVITWLERESGTHSTVEISEGTALVRRSGGVNTEIRYQSGYEHTALYRTSAGTLALGFATKTVLFEDNGDSIDLKLSYTIRHGGTDVSECEMELHASAM